MKPKSIERIENQMLGLEEGSFRYQALACARDFKSSRIRLGQCLYTVYRDRRYKDRG